MSVFAKNSELDQATKRGQLVRDLIGGTPAMIEAGQEYLLKQSAEHADDYRVRLRGGILFNGYKRTRLYLTGLVFSQPLKIDDEVKNKADFEAMENNIDLEDNNLRTWGQELFEAGVDEGLAAVLVDFPVVPMREVDGRLEYLDTDTKEWRPKTAAVDEEKKWRPFFKMIRQQDILGGRFEIINGKKILTQFRFEEGYLKEKGDYDADDEYEKQVRVLYPGGWEVWRKDDSDKPVLEDSGKTSLDFIPVTFFAPGEQVGDIGHFPALEDLAQLNKRHWVATCDQNALMSYVRRPVWFAKMLQQNDAGDIVFGPGVLVHSQDPGGDLKSVGPDDAAVEAGRQELKDLEARMALYGLLALTPEFKGAAKTALQAGQEATESTSLLKDWALALKDCLDNAFKFAALWMGLEEGQEPWVLVNTEFNAAMGLDAQALITAVERGILPRQVAFDEFRRRGLISEANTWEDILGMFARERVGPQVMPDVDEDVLAFAQRVQQAGP